MGRNVVGYKWLPMGPPINWTWLFWITTKVGDWPGWVNGMVGTVLALLWLIWIHEVVARQLREPIFEDVRKKKE